MTLSETLDSLTPGNLQLLQADNGYRYSIDSVLLARFVQVKKGCRIVDLGTGSGVLPLLLARISRADRLYGIELQPGLAERARRNVELNHLGRRIEIVQGDIRNIRHLLPASAFGLVVANPPYRTVTSGRIALDGERAAARHELAGTLDDFIAAAGWLLTSKGRLTIVYLAERLPFLLTAMSAGGIEPKRLRMVHPHIGDCAGVVLVEGIKGARPGLRIEKPLVVYQDRSAKRSYSSEVEQMYSNDGVIDD